MAKDDYVSFGGSLKLKGVKGAKVEKKKKKKKDKEGGETAGKALEKAEQSEKDEKKDENSAADDDQKEAEAAEDYTLHGKTDAERKLEELKRKRYEERLEREGYKTHKEKVEEFNRYLSNLSEHHDMPRIGPG